MLTTETDYASAQATGAVPKLPSQSRDASRAEVFTPFSPKAAVQPTGKEEQLGAHEEVNCGGKSYAAYDPSPQNELINSKPLCQNDLASSSSGNNIDQASFLLVTESDSRYTLA